VSRVVLENSGGADSFQDISKADIIFDHLLVRVFRHAHEFGRREGAYLPERRAAVAWVIGGACHHL
jgi:hypothetical protein